MNVFGLEFIFRFDGVCWLFFGNARLNVATHRLALMHSAVQQYNKAGFLLPLQRRLVSSNPRWEVFMSPCFWAPFRVYNVVEAEARCAANRLAHRTACTQWLWLWSRHGGAVSHSELALASRQPWCTALPCPPSFKESYAERIWLAIILPVVGIFWSDENFPG